MDDIDLVITGKSGDTAHDDIYEQLNHSLFNNTNLANYKHLCGEYPTSSAFALWLASNIVKNETVPEIAIERSIKKTTAKTILIYNHYQKIYHSLMLVSAI
jgi:3-oxoacyl-[acyl-carrier-protein] synthase II